MLKTVAKAQEGYKEILKEICDGLFKNLGFDFELEILEDEENQAFYLKVEPKDMAGLLIGNRGRSLSSLQTVISLMFQKRSGEWRRIILDIANWREKERLRLEDLARKTAEKVRVSGQPQPLYNLTPSQRRIVHLTLSGEKDIKTESVGEGENRYLIVSLK